MSETHPSRLPPLPRPAGCPVGGQVIDFFCRSGGSREQPDETVWLNLSRMSELFGRDKSVISRHIRNVLTQGALPPDSVVANFATTAADGKTYRVDHYNLDVELSKKGGENVT